MVILSIGVIWALRDQSPLRSIAILGYITGAELLWRGTGASVFWEFGKYAQILILMILLFRFAGKSKVDTRGIIYFALLVPSIMLVPEFDREAISFNLTGPLLMSLAVAFFSMVKITKDALSKFLLATLYPCVGLGGLTLFSSLSSESIVYGGSTSAGIGSNQVSSILGLGAFVAFVYLILIWEQIPLRYSMIVIILWLLAQSALTFSRGGFWTTAIAISVIGVYLIRDNKYRIIFIVCISITFLLGSIFILPALDRITSNSISERFADFSLTGREKIMIADLIVFRENPFLGVGPHQSKQYHSITFRYSSTHTEYTRMLAEHGIFGMVALLILVGIVIQRYSQKNLVIEKGIILGFTAWALLFMLHSATRLAAPATLFGIASATFSFQQKEM